MPFEECFVERKKFAKNVLFEIIKTNENKPLTLSLNAPWGFGKTYFLNEFEKYLQEKDYKTINFNAWESDFFNNAFLALYTELIADSEFERSSKEAVNNILKSAIFGAAKISTTLLPIGKEIVAEGIDAIKKLIDSDQIQYNEYTKLKNDINNFKKILKDYCSKQDKPVIFIIDELDRCKPLYALEILEIVKHFLNTENIIFVFAIDRDQISKTIKKVYGNEIDSVGYLRRFFDIELVLPEIEYYKFLKKQPFNSCIIDRDSYEIFDVISSIHDDLSFSLRDVEKFVLTYNLYYQIKSTKTKIEKEEYTFIFLLSLYMKRKDLFEDFINNKISVKKLMSNFKLNKYFIRSRLDIILAINLSLYKNYYENINYELSSDYINSIIDDLEKNQNDNDKLKSYFKMFYNENNLHQYKLNIENVVYIIQHIGTTNKN